MFQGVTPRIVAQFLASELRKKKPARVFVPFAGNFVIEQLATLNVPGVEIHSTDINIYSMLVGFGLTGVECDAMEALYEFTAPPYTNINEAVRVQHLEAMEAQGALMYFNAYHPQNWIEQLPEGYAEVFRWHSTYQKWISVFSNCSEERKAITGSFLSDREQHYPIIGPEDAITKKTKIKFLPVKGDVMNHYRLMWVNKADVKQGAYNWLIFADGKLIGGAVLGSGSQFGIELALIVSDPAAPTSKYPRLSRLIIELICTEEMLAMVNDVSMWQHTGFTTVVFTEHQVSMKYRGLFDLVKREKVKGGKYPLKLTYQNRSRIKRTFKEALSNWVDKNLANEQ